MIVVDAQVPLQGEEQIEEITLCFLRKLHKNRGENFVQFVQ